MFGGAGGGAVVAVSAARAGGQALQQRRDLAVAGGEALVVGQPLRGPRRTSRRLTMAGHRDVDPLLAGPVDGLERARGGAALQAGQPVEAGGPVDDHGLAEDRPPGVGGVAQHGPDHRCGPSGSCRSGPMEERNYFHNLWCRVSDMGYRQIGRLCSAKGIITEY